MALRIPEIRDFKFDFGLYALKVGLPTGSSIAFPDCFVQSFAKVSDELFTASASMEVNGEDKYIVSFDFSPSILEEILKPLPDEETSRIRTALRHQPFQALPEGKVVVELSGTIGEPTVGTYEEFVPILVTKVVSSRFDPTIVLTKPAQS